MVTEISFIEKIQQCIDECQSEIHILTEKYNKGLIPIDTLLHFTSYNDAMIFAYENAIRHSKFYPMVHEDSNIIGCEPELPFSDEN